MTLSYEGSSIFETCKFSSIRSDLQLDASNGISTVKFLLKISAYPDFSE